MKSFGKVKLHFKEDIEPHEILLDRLAKKKEQESGISEKKFEVPLLKKALQGIFYFAIFVILVFFFKTFQLQVLEGKNLAALARENKFIINKIQAERGVIYDRDLKQLVFNRPSFDLVFQKSDLPADDSERQRIFKEVSGITGKNVAEEIERVESNQVLILENLDQEKLILLETKIKEWPGFSIKNNTARSYQDGDIFSHIIGYTGRINRDEFEKAPDLYSISDYVGRAGVESFYEDVLRKNPGKLIMERNAQGDIISQEIISEPESGKSLVLWLDSDLQRKIKEELEKTLTAIGSKKAAALALDPKTGGVLAIVSLPGFDNNLFQPGADSAKLQELLKDPLKLNPLFNRAIAGLYQTGSTIKPLIASAALEEKIISPSKQIYSPGFIEIPHRYDPEKIFTLHDWAVHGWVDMRKAIAQSSNVYFYTIGGGYKDQKGLGPTKIKEYLSLFGWTEKTGIDLPGETAGFVPDKEWKKRVFKEGWWDGDTYYLSIGQQYLQITPLEVASAFSAIANNGKLLQPKVVKEIIAGSAGSPQIIEEFEPKILRENFIKPENLQVVREGMRQAVTGQNSPLASAVLLNSLPVSAGAKTGTAELGNNYYNNWVTVFAPYDDPQIVLTIVIEDVKGTQAVVVPAAREILNWYFSQE